MDNLGQQTHSKTCPHCGEDTVVFPQLDLQHCDRCGETF